MKHLNDLIPAYLDGRLDTAGCAAVRAHCDQCPACANALAESEAVWRMLDSVRVPEPSRLVWAGVAAASSDRRDPAWRRLVFATVSAAALAAGVLVGSQQYAPRVVEASDYADEILSGSLLGGDSVWTLDSALEYILTAADESEEG